ncbi:MAG: hypothetical protein J6Y60_03330 [Treponema sp.]|nr:hypothetical protein [Treponema sp.]
MAAQVPAGRKAVLRNIARFCFAPGVVKMLPRTNRKDENKWLFTWTG